MQDITKGMSNASEIIDANFKNLLAENTAQAETITQLEQQIEDLQTNISLLESPNYLIPCTLQNNWTQVGYNQLAYNKIAPGIPLVVLAGAVQGGIATSGTVITTLPIGYRPRSIMRVIGYRANDSSNAYFNLDKNGELRFAQNHASGTFRFDVVFYTE